MLIYYDFLQADDGVLLSFHACSRSMEIYHCDHVLDMLAEEDPEDDNEVTPFDIMMHTYLLQYFDRSGETLADGANMA